jgi:hypothetical protein
MLQHAVGEMPLACIVLDASNNSEKKAVKCKTGKVCGQDYENEV